MVHEQSSLSSLRVGLRRPQCEVPGVPEGWMSADSCPPLGLRGPRVLAWAGLWVPRCWWPLVGSGAPGGCESLQTPTSGPRGPRLHSTGLPARPGRKEAWRGPEVATFGTLHLPFLGGKRLLPLQLPWGSATSA